MGHTQRTRQGLRTARSQTQRLRAALTPAERRLWSKLRSNQCHSFKLRRQHAIGPFIVDFYCPEQLLVVEIDGDVHAEPKQRAKDRQRENSLRALGLEVIRYTNQDVLTNLDGVLEHLLAVLSTGSTSPRPSLQRRGKKGSQLSTND